MWCSYMIRGHIHNDKIADSWPLVAAKGNVLNAGVDVDGFCPVTFDDSPENNRKFKTENTAYL